jgi:Family of unknown function (DUF6492)
MAPLSRIRNSYRELFVCDGCPHRFRRGLQLMWYKNFQPMFSVKDQGRSAIEVEVVIPAVEKDLETLPYAIEGVRKNLQHPIKRIWVVAPDCPSVRQISERLGVCFIDEAKVAPLRRDEIHYVVAGKDRSGWLLQQLIKLNADCIVETDHLLVLDADTVLIRPCRLEIGGRSVLYAADEYHRPYYEAYERLLGKRPGSLLSFVCHYMLFERSVLSRLRDAIERRSGKPWAAAIAGTIDKNEASGFSEYETYGNFYYELSPGTLLRRYSKNCRRDPAFLTQASRNFGETEAECDSLSFHVYK